MTDAAMMKAAQEPVASLGLGQVALAVLALGVATAFTVFWPLATFDPTLKRAHATAWAMCLLATPAFYVYARRYGRAPLTNWWRLSWTAGFLVSLLHVWWGLGGLHGWDWRSVFDRQGFILAAVIFATTVLWGVDVLLAWFGGRGWATGYVWIRRPAFWIGLTAFLVSTVVFANDVQSIVVGGLLAGAVLTATAQRVDGLGSWAEFFDSPLTPSVIGGVGVISAVYVGFDMAGSAEAAALYTIWPVLLLGGVAAAIFIAKGRSAREDWGWTNWQVAGAAAYCVHFYVAFWLAFDGDVSAVFAAQGALTASANFTLTVLWPLSALLALCGRAIWPVHWGATLLFIAAAALSSLIYADSPAAGVTRVFGVICIGAVALGVAARLTARARARGRAPRPLT